MSIYHYQGYLTKQQAAPRFKMQVRTINDWIRKTTPTPDYVSFIKIDGYDCIKDSSNTAAPPEGISLGALERVRNFAKRNKLSFEQIL